MDQQLKERLVGAVVLMLAAVVFIPMILSGPREPEPGPALTAAEPARPPADFSSRIVPLTPPEVQPPRSVPAPAPAPAAEPAGKPDSQPESESEPAPEPEAAPPKVTATRAPTAEPSPPRSPPATDRDTRAGAAARSGWVVQLGSFSNARNAHALRDRLLGSGFAAFSESASSGADAVTRVYVGPEPDRERAEKHVARLLEQTRLKGIVVRYPGE